jgi:hypothetical protein
MMKELIKVLFDKLLNLWILVISATVSVAFQYGEQKKEWIFAGIIISLLISGLLILITYIANRIERNSKCLD